LIALDHALTLIRQLYANSGLKRFLVLYILEYRRTALIIFVCFFLSSEYARPHTGFSPGGMPRNVPGGLSLGSSAMDPMLHYQLASMYGAGARERLELELEREKRERELRELREREISDRMKEEMLKNGPGMPPVGMGMPGGPGGLGPRLSGGPLDPHWLELHRRLLLVLFL
jgi:hypothetical protein